MSARPTAFPSDFDYHPDPDIDAAIRAEAVGSEQLDSGIGFPNRWWVCPMCGASHNRGWFQAVGVHRCLRCGYVGERGTMHTNRIDPYAEADR